MATAFATVRETARMSRIGGSMRPLASCSGVTIALSARLAGQEHPVRDLGRLRDQGAEADAGEHIHVVALGRDQRAALPFEMRERASGCDEAATVGGARHVLGPALAAARRIRERQNHGLRLIGRHGRQHLGAEQPGLRGDADSTVNFAFRRCPSG